MLLMQIRSWVLVQIQTKKKKTSRISSVLCNRQFFFPILDILRKLQCPQAMSHMHRLAHSRRPSDLTHKWHFFLTSSLALWQEAGVRVTSCCVSKPQSFFGCVQRKFFLLLTQWRDLYTWWWKGCVPASAPIKLTWFYWSCGEEIIMYELKQQSKFNRITFTHKVKDRTSEGL